MVRKRIKDKEYELVNTNFNIHDCHACVFGNNGSCSLVEIHTMCESTNRTHWEEVDKEAEIHNLTVGATPTMNIGDTIEVGLYTYKLDKCLPHPDNKTKCNQCVFGVEGRCCLRDDDNILKDRADELIANCERESTAIYKVVKPIKANCSHDNSSTGVVNPSTDAAPKEPSNDAPRIINKNVKRHIDVVLTLDAARNWYDSHNPILKDLAVRAFTPAELEDVRRCTMNVDIKTAKRLYRNAENAVRDFVLSAFSEEELKD